MHKGAVAEFTDVIQELIGFTFLKADSWRTMFIYCVSWIDLRPKKQLNVTSVLKLATDILYIIDILPFLKSLVLKFGFFRET